jgi:hypothetical protein
VDLLEWPAVHPVQALPTLLRHVYQPHRPQDPQVRAGASAGEEVAAACLMYTLHDCDSKRDGGEEAWAASLPEHGRRCEPSPGPWVKLWGRRLRRWSLRRETANKGQA